MPSRHAILSPSASKRWLTCTPSARLEAEVPSQDTAYTIEGTLAHSCAEWLLDYYWCEHPGTVYDFDILANLLRETNPAGVMDLVMKVTDAGFDFWEIMETVHDNYVAVIWEDLLAAETEKDPGAFLLIEAELKLDDFAPESFGSADCVLIAGDTLSVYDLKYGKGVKVSAVENTQMMCYAIGAVHGPGETYDIKNVCMTIIQPRLHHVSRWGMTYDELENWGWNVLQPRAVQAFAGEGDYVPGEHCKFCRVAARCKALRNAAVISCRKGQQPELMNDIELSDSLNGLELIKNWVASLENYALDRAMSGQRIPGWKIVEGRSVRKIGDQAAAVEALKVAGFEDTDYFKPQELRTISDLEKLVGKKNFPKILGEFVTRTQGKPALVPESDPRPEFNNAEQDFANTL